MADLARFGQVKENVVFILCGLYAVSLMKLDLMMPSRALYPEKENQGRLPMEGLGVAT